MSFHISYQGFTGKNLVNAFSQQSLPQHFHRQWNTNLFFELLREVELIPGSI